MAGFASFTTMTVLFVLLSQTAFMAAASTGNFLRDFDITWGNNGRANILNNGNLLQLSLDKNSGSGFQSKNQYLFGKIHMKMKLIPGNSAGTVTAYYLSSQGPEQEEIDFEFLGNLSGQPYTFHTNVFTQGKGNRKQQFHVWFDPAADFHTYSILWSPQQIVWSVDGVPIRVFKNLKKRGVPYPSSRPMRVYSSLWNADEWAIRGGLVKTDWWKAPFVASYSDFNADACVWHSAADSSACANRHSSNGWFGEEMDATGQQRLKWVRKNYMVYNYCTDPKRSPHGLPPECSTVFDDRFFISHHCLSFLD